MTQFCKTTKACDVWVQVQVLTKVVQLKFWPVTVVTTAVLSLWYFHTHTATVVTAMCSCPKLWNSDVFHFYLRLINIDFEWFMWLLKTLLFGCQHQVALWKTANVVALHIFLLIYILLATTLCLKKNRTPATFCNNSNSPGSIAIDFDKNNR